MGLSGISTTELLIILLIVVLIFGTKRLGTLGSDLGGAIRGFRRAMEGKNDRAPAVEDLVPVAHDAEGAQPARSKTRESTSSER